MQEVRQEHVDYYGPLHRGFTISFGDGQNVIVGRNDIGKSAILQYAVFSIRQTIPVGSFVFIPSQRNYIKETAEMGDFTLSDWNEALISAIQPGIGPAKYDTERLPPIDKLTTLILHKEKQLQQTQKFQKLLQRFGFEEFDLAEKQVLMLGSFGYSVHGSGARAIAPILASLTTDTISHVFIDEPEFSLEPRLQKVLADVIKEYSSKKIFILATHSHFFLNREVISNNIIIEKDDAAVVIANNLSQENELVDITFRLLGNSLSDLFFPNNFLIVEGGSDQEIVQKVVELNEKTNLDVKVISAQGYERMPNLARVVQDALKPLILPSSPYRDKVVVLVDEPNSDKLRKLEIISELTQDGRYFELPQKSLEEYLHEDLYQRAGLEKQKEIQNIDDAGSYEELFTIKSNISNKISSVLETEDLGKYLSIINSAVVKALEKS